MRVLFLVFSLGSHLVLLNFELLHLQGGEKIKCEVILLRNEVQLGGLVLGSPY